jgi:hypothetical protein
VAWIWRAGGEEIMMGATVRHSKNSLKTSSEARGDQKQEKKNSFFQKQSEEVIENTGPLWKKQPKQTGNKPKTKLAKLLKIKDHQKNKAKTNRKQS